VQVAGCRLRLQACAGSSRWELSGIGCRLQDAWICNRLFLFAGVGRHRSTGCFGMVGLMLGPNPVARMSKRSWEGAMKEWRNELRAAANLFRGVRF
jgi:hypothetical protein